MITYKLLRSKGGKLYPLFVEGRRELPMGEWLEARIGEIVDEGHIRSRLGHIALRPGWHSTEVPFTDWIGKKGADGKLHQRKGTVWCECEVDGEEQKVADRHGLRMIPDGYYYFRTKPGQPFPWIISRKIKINRVLEHPEVERICQENGVEAQPLETS